MAVDRTPSAATPSARDPFANDVLERLARSNQDYQRSHGHYIVPLADRLLAARAELARLWRYVMGDDGTGHCRGCGCALDQTNPDCGVCSTALCAFMDEEVDSDGKPF